MPLLKELIAEARCAILTNKNGNALILYDKDLSLEVEYAEYDLHSGAITLVLPDGKLKPVGLKIGSTVRRNLKLASSLTIALLQDREMQKVRKVPFFLQN